MQEMMKTISFGFSHLLRLALVIAIPLLTARARAQDVIQNGIAANINGHVITKNELALLMAPTMKELQQRFPNRGVEFEGLFTAARNGVMKELLDRYTIIDQFDHLGIKIAPKAIDGEIQREIRDNYKGNADSLRDALKSCRITMDGFRMLIQDRLLEIEIRKQLPKEE